MLLQVGRIAESLLQPPHLGYTEGQNHFNWLTALTLPRGWDLAGFHNGSGAPGMVRIHTGETENAGHHRTRCWEISRWHTLL